MTLNNSQARLTSFVERIERLIEEKKDILAQIADVKLEAKSAGFEPKVINQMIKERSMSDAERQEWQALCEMYRAALGMLDGTPMSDNTRRRFGDDPSESQAPDAPNMFDGDEPEELAPAPKTDMGEARREGGNAFHEGRKVTENPYGAHDPARAAWDEGYCSEAGSDGMEIPPAWRRSTPKKDGVPGGDA